MKENAKNLYSWFFMQIGGFLPDCKLAKYKMQNGNI